MSLLIQTGLNLKESELIRIYRVHSEMFRKRRETIGEAHVFGTTNILRE